MCFDFVVTAGISRQSSGALTELTLNDGRPNYIDIMERSKLRTLSRSTEMAIRSWGMEVKAAKPGSQS